MSLILKGIDLPETKDDRYIIQVYKSGDVYIGKETWDGNQKGRDKIVNAYLGEFQAIQIPKDHGRIGDLDEIIKSLPTEYLGSTVHAIINEAPTILESEE